MNFKKEILLISFILILISLFAVYASDIAENNSDIQLLLDNTDESDLIGCCSVVLQMDGNESMISFRRDAKTYADIFIEKVDWHGTPAIKQYKTDGEYFCQVIITDDGWVVGCGGKDDGVYNEIIENITAQMITEENNISEGHLQEIQQIKALYKIGHVVIKDPDGNYGVATANSFYTGKLKPGEYVSIPNREGYIRYGNLTLNNGDKVKEMTDLAASDMFGLTRRDISTFHFYSNDNFTTYRNITDIYISNDDGSRFNMACRNMVDNVYINGKVINASDIPIAPEYKDIGNITFEKDIPNRVQMYYWCTMIFGILAIFVAVLLATKISLTIVRFIKNNRHRR
ncbi:hypothetical protein TL18_04890 [Methanobrevibacter sp. YE315]|uniref:hypothetical protein n=1 Tax=Methanobrevibacter sp. YE315 TaxID=1609968 RepID=UPI000764E026|nr:hypothetical protein [Methanobrevibacter sp. YE315]AMD17412.1 hypothetical protein TL18_04890 [Methanobrevibacter sp. YE315]